jgi:hypothetical protein
MPYVRESENKIENGVKKKFPGLLMTIPNS